MGIKGKIKGSYLYTQWKLGKYTKRRVKHSIMDNYNYYEDDSPSYNENPTNSYSTSERSDDRNRNNRNYNEEINNRYSAPGTYNRMAYYPAMNENTSRQDYYYNEQ